MHECSSRLEKQAALHELHKTKKPSDHQKGNLIMSYGSISTLNANIVVPKIPMPTLPKLPAQKKAGPVVAKDLLSGANSIKMAVPLIGASSVTVKAAGFGVPPTGQAESVEVRTSSGGSSVGVKLAGKERRTAVVATIELGKNTSISVETVAGSSHLKGVSASQKLSNDTTATVGIDSKSKLSFTVESPNAKVTVSNDGIKAAITFGN